MPRQIDQRYHCFKVPVSRTRTDSNETFLTAGSGSAGQSIGQIAEKAGDSSGGANETRSDPNLSIQSLPPFLHNKSVVHEASSPTVVPNKTISPR